MRGRYFGSVGLGDFLFDGSELADQVGVCEVMKRAADTYLLCKGSISFPWEDRAQPGRRSSLNNQELAVHVMSDYVRISEK